MGCQISKQSVSELNLKPIKQKANKNKTKIIIIENKKSAKKSISRSVDLKSYKKNQFQDPIMQKNGSVQSENQVDFVMPSREDSIKAQMSRGKLARLRYKEQVQQNLSLQNFANIQNFSTSISNNNSQRQKQSEDLIDQECIMLDQLKMEDEKQEGNAKVPFINIISNNLDTYNEWYMQQELNNNNNKA